MRDYEIVYIFDSMVPEEGVQEKIERYHQVLTQGGQAEITALDDWGQRQLAYPIRKRTNGHYVVAQFTAPAEALPEFERVIRLDDDLLRYLIVLNEGEPTAPISLASREIDDRRDDDHNDEDEDGEDED